MDDVMVVDDMAKVARQVGCAHRAGGCNPPRDVLDYFAFVVLAVLHSAGSVRGTQKTCDFSI
jgi:hypothetical protein